MINNEQEYQECKKKLDELFKIKIEDMSAEQLEELDRISDEMDDWEKDHYPMPLDKSMGI